MFQPKIIEKTNEIYKKKFGESFCDVTSRLASNYDLSKMGSVANDSLFTSVRKPYKPDESTFTPEINERSKILKRPAKVEDLLTIDAKRRLIKKNDADEIKAQMEIA